MNKSPVRILLQGRVQGVGLRPAVLRWAHGCGITGWIANDAQGVVIHAEGDELNIKRFLQSLQDHLPVEAEIASLTVATAKSEGSRKFLIRQQVCEGPLLTVVPVDVVTCDQCTSEVLPGEENRRQSYAFNSCAQCGPRYSLLTTMPFEREHTSMASFLLCSTCDKEYHYSVNRRFHAQTMSCPQCGPAIILTDHQGKLLAQSQVAITGIASAIMAGKIIAVKGLGGYQLICDATDEEVVASLRDRKGRCSKPLAVMVKDLAMAARLADIAGCESTLLSRAGPIVLCPAKPDNELAYLVHPGLNDVGLMLPTTSYHRMLCESINKPLVVTSGNREGEPLVYTREAAQAQLGAMCDQILHHDRVIHRPIDDSVVRKMAGRVATIRLARGFAPHRLPVMIREPIAALGAQHKVALALSNGNQAILGPHLGEMDTIAAQERFHEQYYSLCQLYGTTPQYLVHDLHLDYFTTRWAQEQPQHKIAVQHHHAHVVAGMLEHGWLTDTVLGIAFDGTGYGHDGTIWGGEILLCTTKDFQRLAHLRPFRLLGGEQAIRQPHRVTLALLDELLDRPAMINMLRRMNRIHRYESLLPLLEAPHLHPLTSSVGRLFDGVAALILSLIEATYEGEPAMMLEAICDLNASASYPLPLIEEQLDWRPMLQALLDDLISGTEPGTLAMRFHRGLAEAVVAIIRGRHQYPVVLTGGCFQNKILVELIHELLDDDRRVGLPGVIPCNDGGLAAGQLVISAARLNCLGT